LSDKVLSGEVITGEVMSFTRIGEKNESVDDAKSSEVMCSDVLSGEVLSIEVMTCIRILKNNIIFFESIEHYSLNEFLSEVRPSEVMSRCF
jgi:hypothetical protein